MGIGDKVVMNGKYIESADYKGTIFTVASEPWDCYGKMVVNLEGQNFAYAVDGLTVVNQPLC